MKKESKYISIEDPVNIVGELLLSNNLAKVRKQAIVDPDLAWLTLFKIQKSFQFTYNKSRKNQSNKPVISSAIEMLCEVGEIVGLGEDSYNIKSHEMLMFIGNNKNFTKAEVANLGVSGKEFITALGALGVAMRMPEHFIMRRYMCSAFMYSSRNFEHGYYEGISSLIGTKEGII